MIIHVLPVFQPYFADVQFPESNFVNQIESLLKDPEEKAKFFQVFKINSINTQPIYSYYFSISIIIIVKCSMATL